MVTTHLRRIRYGAVALLLSAAACVDAPIGPAPATDVLGSVNMSLTNKPPIDQTLEGEAWVCKDGSGPATNFTFAVSVNGGAATNHTVALGTCVQVASVPTNVVNSATISVTEAPPPANWALTSIVIESNSTSHQPVINPPNASARITHDFGIVVTFTNTFTPPPPPNLQGRMTGGGAQIFGDVKITRGFTIHCDIVLSNNLEINWGKGNKWHIDKPLTKATCIDDPAYQEEPPIAPFNTFIGEGIGRLNGVDGSKVFFTFIDAGEPGKNDKAAIKIIAPDGVTVVLDIPLVLLDHGNIQAHFDQPHGQKP